MKKGFSTVIAAGLLIVPAICSAATVTLTATDAGGTSSFNSAGNWSDGNPPALTNDYVVGVEFLRTPPDSNAHVFQGNSLDITTDGSMIYKGWGTSVLTITNLILSGGYIRSGSGPSDRMVLEGGISVSAPGSYIHADQCNYTINSDISGSSSLEFRGGYWTTLAGTVSLSADINVTGNMSLATNGVVNFVIGASGVNNAVTGTGTAELHGTFNLDLTSAGTTDGDSWDLVSVSSATYTTNFSINGFTEISDGVWNYDSGSAVYVFYEAAGLLQVSSLIFGSTSPANGETGVTNQPVLEAEIIDAGDQVDPGSILLKLDGDTVAHSVSKVGTTSTVSYAVSSPLDPLSTYTVELVVSGQSTGPFTNTWSFSVAAEPVIVYVDAVSGASGNTMEWGGSQWVEFSPPSNTSGGGDGQWEEEWSGDPANLFGNLPSTSNSWFEAGREGAEDCPELRTRVTGLSNGTYEVYAYYWRADGQSMYLGADLTSNASGGLPVYDESNTNVALAVQAAFVETTNIMVRSADRSMYQVSLGSVAVTNGILDVFIDDVGDGSTIWYDGIGYIADTGLSVDPDIQSISVAGGTVSLTWSSETVGTYKIQRKTDLTAATWDDVKTGIAGGDPTTSDSVSASGADQEFYRIEGN